MERQVKTAESSVSDEDSFCLHCGASSFVAAQATATVCEHCLLGLALRPPGDDLARDRLDARASQHFEQTWGSYAVLEEIGRGGMGIIYRAAHCKTGEIVAIKTVLPQHTGCSEILARFKREAEAASSLFHRHSLPIYEVGLAPDGVPFFSMQLASGGSLHQLKEKYRGRWRQTAELMVKIAEAVQHAHDQGILHRDLKPGNVLFTEEQEPMVADFGLAKRFTATDDLTQSCAILGTPNYVAPEQAAGNTKDLTAAADIYGLGAIFFELLAGRPPIVGDNPLDVLRRIAEESPPRPSQLVPNLPKALDTICRRCLAKKPIERYCSAQAFADDLMSWLGGRKIAAKPFHIRLERLRPSRLVASFFCTGMLLIFLSAAIGWKVFHHMNDTLNETTRIVVSIEDLDQNVSLQSFAKQTTEALKEELARHSGFRVQDLDRHGEKYPADVFDPVAYGRAVNAQTVLTGSVRHSGGHVQLVTRLLNCTTGDTIWRRGDTLSSDQLSSNLLAVAIVVVNELQTRWQTDPNFFSKPLPPIASPAAIAFVNRAREFAARANHDDLNRSIELCQRAIKLSPKYAQAHALLAYSYFTAVDTWGEADKLPLALATGKYAVSLCPDSAESHATIARCYLREARYQEAMDEFWKALEVNPRSASCNFCIGTCLREMGHPEQAVPWMTRAMKLDPIHGIYMTGLGETLILSGCDDQAEAILQQGSTLDPDQPYALVARIILRLWQKQPEEARQLCAELRHHFPDYQWGLNVAALIAFSDGKVELAKAYYEELRGANNYQRDWECYGAINPSSALAYMAKQSGATQRAKSLTEEALRVDQELLTKFPRNARILHDLAATWSVAGDSQQAQDYFEKAISAGWVEHRSTMIDPRFFSLRADPRFEAVLTRGFAQIIPRRVSASVAHTSQPAILH